LYGDLQKLLMKEMASILHDDILIGSQKVPLFKIRILDGFDEPSYLDSSVDLPMYTLAIEQVRPFFPPSSRVARFFLIKQAKTGEKSTK
jgi:hypothetical protein